jgi:high-affinity iron transporter
MKALFDASTLLLLVTAVVLLGKGLHALGTLSILPVKPIPIFEFEPLGIYPDLFNVGPQLVLALAAWLWFFWKRRTVSAAAQSVGPTPGGFESP